MWKLLSAVIAVTAAALATVKSRVEASQSDQIRTKVAIVGSNWQLNGRTTYCGTPVEGLLLNARMVNSVFEDANNQSCPAGFSADANTEEFLARIPEYVAGGLRAFTVSLQGGYPGYEGAVNSAFEADGSLRAEYLARVKRVVEACDEHGAAVILSCFYQRQDEILADEDAVRRAVVHVAEWLREEQFTNVVLEVTNEFGHDGFDHGILKTPAGQVELIQLARQIHPDLLASTSGLGDGTVSNDVANASDFLLVHFNNTPVAEYEARVAVLRQFGKPIVCNEDDKALSELPAAARRCIELRVSWGLMAEQLNQHFPFAFRGLEDAPDVYATMQHLTTADDYFPPAESTGGWRALTQPDDMKVLSGMDADKLEELREWLLASDERDFAAVVIRRGFVVLQVERGNSAVTNSRRVASVSKAVCATVLAIAAERSQQGGLPKTMSFDDPAFDFIPWAQPLSDPAKARITVRQLFNHTSGICPEALGAPNDGDWEYVLGLSGDPRTARLAFEPGTGCGYSTHAFCHAALVCETVTGKPYDEFAVEALFRPLGCEHWWFQYYDGGERIGRRPSHGLGMPARDLARIAYCMLREGRWNDRQVVPRWFVDETATPTHTVEEREMRWGYNADYYSHAWELPGRLRGENANSHRAEGIPVDARYKPGSGGQLIAFVPSLDLVLARQTGSSGPWEYDEFLRRACAAVLP